MKRIISWVLSILLLGGTFAVMLPYLNPYPTITTPTGDEYLLLETSTTGAKAKIKVSDILNGIGGGVSLRTGNGLYLHPEVNIFSGDYNFIVGYGATVQGFSTMSMGYGSNVSGDYAISIGKNNNINGETSLSFGNYNMIQNKNGFAIGNGNTIMGENGFVIGNSSVVFGDNSFALGNHGIANGVNSISLGYYTIANGVNSIAMGTYNIGYSNSIFEIGIGSSLGGARNAMTITNNGEVYLNQHTGYSCMGTDNNGKVIPVSCGIYSELDPVFLALSGQYYTDNPLGYITGQYWTGTSFGIAYTNGRVAIGGIMPRASGYTLQVSGTAIFEQIITGGVIYGGFAVDMGAFSMGMFGYHPNRYGVYGASSTGVGVYAESQTSSGIALQAMTPTIIGTAIETVGAIVLTGGVIPYRLIISGQTLSIQGHTGGNWVEAGYFSIP